MKLLRFLKNVFGELGVHTLTLIIGGLFAWALLYLIGWTIMAVFGDIYKISGREIPEFGTGAITFAIFMVVSAISYSAYVCLAGVKRVWDQS